MQTIIQKNLVLQRWDTLPQEIRDVMTSDKNAETLDRIYENLHIPPEKQKFVSLVVSYVFFGFVHLEDMAKEIEGAIAINSLHARELADAINQGVFAPYRDMLEKIYTGKITEPVRPSIDSIRAPEQKPDSGPKPLASFAPAPIAAPVPSASPKPAPAPFSSPKFTATPSPLPALGGVPAKPLPASASVVPPASAKPSPVAAPAPFMMQAETKVQTIAQAPKFTMESLGKASSAFGGRTGASEALPKIAQVELGQEEKPKPTGVVSKYTEAAPRTIHYSSLSTPLPAGLGTSSTGPVSMGSLQGTSPVPATPSPKPVAPPSAPVAPIPPGSGGFIKTLITPKNEKPAPGLPLPPQK